MALDLFKLLGTIEVDNSKANEALDQTSATGQKAESKLSKAFGAVGKCAAAVGKAVVKGLAVGGAAFAGLTAKALSASGELEQNMGGSEAVFKEYATKMQDTARQAFSNMGLSTSDYLATANKMGALFQGAGFSIEESMNLSSGAMQRAADVASIMGIDTSAAMEAIAGAAKGNFTMMDNLGVAMNDTTLQAYALEKGIKKSTSEMTNQEKIGLAMEMFMDKTAYAAGNYAKENETLAGSLGTAKAALTNFLDGSGSVEDLVASFGNLAKVATKSLQEILPRLVTGLTDIVNQIMPMIPPLLNQLLPSIIRGATGLINGLISALPGVLSVLMDVVPYLLEAIVTITDEIIYALPGLVASIVSVLPELIPGVVDAIIGFIQLLCIMLPEIIQPIIDNLPQIITSIVDALMTNLPMLIDGVVELIVGLVAALPQIIQVLIEALPTILTSIVQGLIAAAPILWEGIKSIWNTAVDAIKAIFETLKNFLSSAWEALGKVPGLSALKTHIETVWGAIKNVVSTYINAVKNVVTTVWNSIKNVVSTVINSIKNVISTVWEAIKTIIMNVMNIIFSVIQGDWDSVKQSISNILNAIKSVISSVWNGIKAVISSVLTGIKNTVSSVWNGVKNIISSVIDGIKSTVTSKFNLVKDAMEKPIQKARDTIKGMIDKIKDFFSSAKLEFPNIKLPHIKITGKLSLNPPSVPKLSIEWYKKAMENPMIMNEPTIFGYNPATGSFMGGGDAGSEVVSGTNTLMNMIQGAVAAQNEALVYYLQKLVEMLADYFPQVLEGVNSPRPAYLGDPDYVAKQLAVPMNYQLGRLSTQKERGR